MESLTPGQKSKDFFRIFIRCPARSALKLSDTGRATAYGAAAEKVAQLTFTSVTRSVLDKF